MEQKSLGRLLPAVGVIGPALLAFGTWFPLVKTTLGYSYSAYGNAPLVIYGVAVLALTLNLVSDKVSADIVKRLHFVMIAMLLGCLVYGTQVSKEGTDWFSRQAAYDAPGWEQSNKDAYWKNLYGYGYGQNIWMVGTLRRAYELYGPGVLMNDQPIFQDTINSLTVEQARELTASAGAEYSVIPFGIAAYLGSLGAQIFILILLARRLKTAKAAADAPYVN